MKLILQSDILKNKNKLNITIIFFKDITYKWCNILGYIDKFSIKFNVL